MLRELYIKNFGIFAEARQQFAGGMIVLSGETGAGKSLVVGALSLILGARASAEDIRSGCEEAQVEAVFAVAAEQQQAIQNLLSDMGFSLEENILTIRRVLQSNGRSRNFINGASATVTQLASIGECLIDLSGQHEQQILMDETRHLGLLDDFAGHMALLTQYQQQHKAVWDLEEKLITLRQRLQTAAERADFLQFRVKELDLLKLRLGESEELRETLQRLQHAQKLFDVARHSVELLSEGEGAVAEQLGTVRRQLERNLDYDPTLKARLKEIQDAESILAETTALFQSYLQKLTFDPGERDKMEERLFKLSEVARKYGSVEQAVAQLETMRAELAALENVDADLQQTLQLKEAALKQMQSLGKQLTTSRQAAATKLASATEKELQELAMEGARLSVERLPIAVENLAALGNGFETVRCLFSANRGEELRPLAKVASGGELSRVLLAIKLVLGQGKAQTYIFDEIDAGIGGRQAEVIGKKLQSLAKAASVAQVLCVTHLAPIAAYGKQHLFVNKQQVAGRTVAQVRLLTQEERVQEMARMLAGERITARTVAHAAELLQNT